MQSMDSFDRSASTRMQVIMVPLPAQGHLNQLLHLSRTLAQRGVSVLYLATSAHIQQVRHRVQGWETSNFDIRFEEVPMPDLPAEEPDIESTHKFPTHLIPLFEAFQAVVEPHLDLLLRHSSDKRVVVVHDNALGWVQTVAVKNGIPAYTFIAVGAYPYLWWKWTTERTWTAITPSSAVNISLDRCFPQRSLTYFSKQVPLLVSSTGEIFNSFWEMESEFISRAREELIFGDRPVWTVGPLLPQAFFHDKKQVLQQPTNSECLSWLDSQTRASVLYVSFGSVSSLSASEIRELAEGLERCGQPFLWVLRIPDSVRFSTPSQSDWIHQILPKGFEKRTEGRGLIVRDWAPQLQILRHISTGAFLTHCGWNSTLESVCAGVPMIAWPLHSDQFANSILISRELKVGVEVKEWRNAEENELVRAEEIGKAVRRVMGSEEGVQMRKRAQHLREEARKAIEEEGSSWKNVDSLIHHFSQQFGR